MRPGRVPIVKGGIFFMAVVLALSGLFSSFQLGGVYVDRVAVIRNRSTPWETPLRGGGGVGSKSAEIERISRQIKERRCPAGSKILLLFPHVNKAGGRSMEATFEALGKKELRHRYISQAPRSRTHTFDIVDHHKTFAQIASERHCFSKSDSGVSCESKSTKQCVRWVFTLRDPVQRTMSAFYTATGRDVSRVKVPRASLKTAEGAFGGSHFFCKPGSRAANVLRRAKSSIEDWVSLPLKERLACESAFNLHVKYLAPEEKSGSDAQLALAKKRLEAMVWFGLTEKWVESMQLMMYSLGTDLVHYTPTFNDNTYDHKLSERGEKVLRMHNALDIKLYEFAVELFEKRLDIMRNDLVDPFSTKEPFVCDSHKICWDKSTPTPFWTLESSKAGASFDSVGKRKENVLCTFHRGCTRRDVVKEQEQSSVQEVVQDQGEDDNEIEQVRRDGENNENGEAPSEERLKCLASFLILGARKGGTTSLYQYVAQHPKFLGIKLDDDAQSGELLVFHRLDHENSKTSATIAKQYNVAMLQELERANPEYSRQDLVKMIAVEKTHMTGESSVVNGPYCFGPSQIKRACGDKRMRMVYLLRDPIERIVSQYNMRIREGTMDASVSMEEMVKKDLADVKKKLGELDFAKIGIEGLLEQLPCLYLYDYENSVWSGMYVVHIERWMRSFDRGSLMLIESRDFFKQPGVVLQRVLNFVGLDVSSIDIDRVVSKQYNTASSPMSARSDERPEEKLSAETREQLVAFFQPFNEALKQRFNVDL